MEYLCKLAWVIVVVAAQCHAQTPLQRPAKGHFHEQETAMDSNKGSPKWRIPTDVIPVHYKIELIPVLTTGVSGIAQYDVKGIVTITIKCVNRANTIYLHALELGTINPEHIHVWNVATPGTPISVRTVVPIPQNEAIRISLGETLVVDEQYLIKVSYTAKIPPPDVANGRTNGLYRTSYTQAGGIKELATTHFSRTRGFRKLVPSFDEPLHKAVFEISIGRLEKYHTLSNMNKNGGPVAIDGMPGWFWDHYNPTPIMAPTIIAMVISEMSSKEAPTNPKVKIWGPLEVIAEQDGGAFAADAVARILSEYENYFEIEYELPKMDSVGVNDFGAGAMENWGLNIYRSAYMFITPSSTTEAKFDVASVISHELAHQWWGNLVTHKWWNDWWLTEGFATYYQFKTFHAVFPEYGAEDRQVTDELQNALAFDITEASRPIHGPSDTEFMTNPGAIDYSKGSSLVKMMSGFLTETSFKKAVMYYLNKRNHTAVDQTALFGDLQEYILTDPTSAPSNGKEMSEIMDAWTTRTGYPIVFVSTSISTPNTIYFSQKPFQIDYGTDTEPHWYIPVSYISRADGGYEEGNLSPKVWLNKGVRSIPHSFNTKDWILVNPDARGYYRVLYDEHFALMLQKQLVRDIASISPASRSQIIDDYLSATLKQYTRFDVADKMISFIQNDLAHTSWISFLKHFRKAYNLLAANAGDLVPLQTYLLPKLESVLERINREPQANDPIPTLVLRTDLLDWECGLGGPTSPCAIVADRLFDAWMAGTCPEIPVDLRAVVYCRALAKGTPANWDFLRTKYATTKDPVIRSSFRCTSVQANLDTLLTEVQDTTNPLGAAEAWGYMTAVAGSATRAGRGKVVTLLQAGLVELVNRFKVDGLIGVFSAMAPLVQTPEEIGPIEAFLANENFAVQLNPVRATLQGSVAIMNTNTALLAKFQARIGQFLPSAPR